MTDVCIFWFRRDLRLEDNHSLFEALKGEFPVQPVFIFDTNILDKLEDPADARVTFIYHEIEQLQRKLAEKGTSLDVRIGQPLSIWKKLIDDYRVKLVYANRDYEPYARSRDKEVYDLLKSNGISFKSKKDHVIFEKEEVVKENGTPYTVYTPYSKKWKALLTESHLRSFSSGEVQNWNQTSPRPLPLPGDIGFTISTISFPKKEVNIDLINNYHEKRDYPALQGTSRLSVHLRFGTISIRQLVQLGKGSNEKYLNELIWRDFYQAILWHFPRVVDENFQRKYDGIEWRNNEEEFKKWCDGKTGYPIVDAGMRELNTTGFMHNRVRMIVASFLTKHLLIDWRWGEAYFAEKLLDFELASNNGGWQWAAGTGVDAAPYFRIFNPYTQTEKFDPKQQYIHRWIPELNTPDYPTPIVDHKLARQRALDVYKTGIDR